MDLLQHMEHLKKDMCFHPGYNTVHLFRCLTDKEYISEKALKNFLIKMGHQPLKEELNNIMRRVDLSANHQISFEEFCEAVEPTHVYVNAHDFR